MNLLFALALAWSSSGPTGGAVNAVAVVAQHPEVVWAGSAAGVFRSTDGGATWTSVGGAIVDVARVVAHPSNADRAWALSTSQDLFRTGSVVHAVYSHHGVWELTLGR